MDPKRITKEAAVSNSVREDSLEYKLIMLLTVQDQKRRHSNPACEDKAVILQNQFSSFNT